MTDLDAEDIEFPPGLDFHENGNVVLLREPHPSKLTWTQLSEIEMKSPRFADKPLWQVAAFHLVCGMKGAGKGTYLSLLAARVTRGELGDNRNVIWVAIGEDSHAIDVHPRIVAAGGNPELVSVVTSGRIRLPDDVDEIRWKADDLGNVGLVVIDSISACLKSGKSANDDVDVREALDPLNDLADKLDTLIAGVRHIGKDRSRGALASVLGSVEWVNVPRAVLIIAADDEEDELHHVQAWGNRVKRGEDGRSFRIEGVMLPSLEEPVTKAVEIGVSGKDVEELLNSQLPAGRKRVPSASLQALILRELESGEKSREHLDDACQNELGANPDSVYKYGLASLRKENKVKARKGGVGEGWFWRISDNDK